MNLIENQVSFVSGISIRDAWKDPVQMRRFLEAHDEVIVSSRADSMQKKYNLANDTFKVQDREAAVNQVLQLWFDRQQTLKEKLKEPRIQHIVVAASPGKFFFMCSTCFSLKHLSTCVGNL